MRNPVRYIILGFAIFLIFVVVSISVNLGLFKEPILVGIRPLSLKIVYKEQIGAYYKLADAFVEMENTAKRYGLQCSQTVGIYLDDPEKVSEDRQRAHIGCVVEQGDPIDNRNWDFKIKQVKLEKALKITFDGSPAAGPIKVYPMADQWFIDNGVPKYKTVTEVYSSMPSGDFLTEYYFPIDP